MAASQALGRSGTRLGRIRTRIGRTVVRGLVVVAVALFGAFPLFWMAAGSLKTAQELTRVPPVWLPGSPSLDAFAEVARLLPLGSGFLNSFLIAGISAASVVVTSTLAGFAFARYSFRGRDSLFYLLLATMFVPPITTLVPLFWLVGSVGLTDSLAGVLLPQLANAFGIFLIRQFARGLPTELLEAARIDGASELQILRLVAVPLMLPAIATLGLFAFVYYWNSFLWPLAILQSSDKFPIVLVINGLLSYTTAVRYANVVLAGTLLAVLPNIVLFIIVRRAYRDTALASAVKG
jgi:multiple sugar transport system permease protein